MTQPSSRARRRANKIRNQRIILGVIAVIIVALAAFFLFQSLRGPDNKPQGVEEAQDLQIEDIEAGDGPIVQNGDNVVVHYTGWLTNGKKFDSSLDRGQPFEFTVGSGSVIQGWEKGLLGMQVGGKRRLIIPPSLAYGDQGVGNIIPSNSTLVFEIELIEIK